MLTKSQTEYTLVVDEEERAELLRLLEAGLVETHAERRRTEAPQFQAQVGHEESVLRTLTEKVRRLAK